MEEVRRLAGARKQRGKISLRIKEEGKSRTLRLGRTV